MFKQVYYITQKIQMIIHKENQDTFEKKPLSGRDFTCPLYISILNGGKWTAAQNYLSLKEEIVLSMLAGNDTEHPEHLITTKRKERYLKSAVIYGANASGKSNVLNAFWFMVNYVLTSHDKQLHKPIDRIPFKFDRNTLEKPSEFEVIFTAGNVRYVYGFSVTDREVVEEYLYYYPNGRQAIIFERKNSTEYRFTTDAEEQERLRERTSVNKLYLSVAANWNYKKVVPVFEWFASCKILTKNETLTVQS